MIKYRSVFPSYLHDGKLFIQLENGKAMYLTPEQFAQINNLYEQVLK